MNDFKLSKRAISVIENFSKINPSILFRAGDVLRTVSIHTDVFGVAKLDINIPDQFGIGDVSRFLNVIRLYEDPLLNIVDGKTLVIKGKGTKKFKYTLAPEKTIATLRDDWKGPDLERIAQFNLTGQDLIALRKNISVAGLTEVAFNSDGTRLFVEGKKAANPTTDIYSSEIEVNRSTFSHTPFNIVFVDRKINNMIDSDYKVTVMPTIVRFESTADFEYYIAPELISK
jgi:hypothetical protein